MRTDIIETLPAWADADQTEAEEALRKVRQRSLRTTPSGLPGSVKEMVG